MNEDDRLPPLPPFAESLLRAEQRRPPPPASARRALWRRARRTLVTSGFLAPALLAGKVTGAALATKLAAIALVVATVGVGAAIKLSPESPVPVKPNAVESQMPPVVTQQPSPVVPAPAAQPPPDPTARFNAEAALIDEARAALARHHTRRASEALSRHLRTFPAGVFQEEREALRVVCLALDGRREQARAAADRFRLRFPRSLFRDVVDRALLR